MNDVTTRVTQTKHEATVLPHRFAFTAGLRKFAHSEPTGAIAGVVWILILLVVFIGSFLVPYDPVKINLEDKFISPGFGEGHLFGTDQIGRDLLSRVLVGGRLSLMVALGALVLGAGTGLVLGIIGGYATSWPSQLLQRFMDGMQALPGLVLTLAVAAALGQSAGLIMIAISIGTVPGIYRIMRGATLAVRGQDYVTAASALGATDARVVMRHVLPNVIGTLITLGSIQIGSLILVEASLGFLGIGEQAPNPTWGNMLSGEGRNYMERAPWIAIIPGLAISLAVLASNMLGDALRTYMDPKLRRLR